jgi:hypothetical protein
VSERKDVIEQIKFLTRIADHESVRFEDPTDAVESLFDLIAALEARAETGVTVAWWIGPHDGLLAGATTNKSLADARIEHGATVRPLVFGDVATGAKARVTDEMREAGARALCLGFRMTHRDGDQYAPYDHCTEEGKNVWRGLANTTLHAALTGGASDGR